jgi:hypothetical protein
VQKLPDVGRLQDDQVSALQLREPAGTGAGEESKEAVWQGEIIHRHRDTEARRKTGTNEKRIDWDIQDNQDKTKINF